MQMPSGRLSPPSAVTVDAPARLHLGFIDPNASLGRAFGSVGLTIDGHGTRITARLAEATRVEGAGSDGADAPASNGIWNSCTRRMAGRRLPST